MNKKAEMFNKLLENAPESVFNVQEAQDEMHSLVYHSTIEVNDKSYYFIIIFDDTDTTVINMLLNEGGVNQSNYHQVVEFCNEQNRSNRVMRYYVDEDKRVLVDCCLTAREEFFDPEVIATLIDAMAENVAGCDTALQEALG